MALQRDMAALAVVALVACAHSGDYIWVDALKETPQPTDKEYVIGPGDLLNIRVWNQDGISGKMRVRGDGKISLPFLNDVEASGMAPSVLARRIQTRLKDFIVNPVVTISLEETQQLVVSVVGEVTKPGSYPLQPGAGVLQALAAASGMTEFANKDRIFVLRQGYWADSPNPVRIRFTFKALSQIEGKAATFKLKSGDVVVVE